MKILLLIGAIAVVTVLVAGAWFLVTNLTLSKGKRK